MQEADAGDPGSAEVCNVLTTLFICEVYVRLRKRTTL